MKDKTYKLSFYNLSLQPNLSKVKLSVFDITEREISILLNEQLEPGRYEYKFSGSNFASVVYFYKIQSGTFSVVKKMFLIKYYIKNIL